MSFLWISGRQRQGQRKMVWKTDFNLTKLGEMNDGNEEKKQTSNSSWMRKYLTYTMWHNLLIILVNCGGKKKRWVRICTGIHGKHLQIRNRPHVEAFTIKTSHTVTCKQINHNVSLITVCCCTMCTHAICIYLQLYSRSVLLILLPSFTFTPTVPLTIWRINIIHTVYYWAIFLTHKGQVNLKCSCFKAIFAPGIIYTFTDSGPVLFSWGQ